MKKKRFLTTHKPSPTSAGFTPTFEQLTAINFFAYQLFRSVVEFEKRVGQTAGSLQKFFDGKSTITESLYTKIKFAVLGEMQKLQKVEKWEEERMQTCYSYLLQLFPELKITDQPKQTMELASVRNPRKKLTVTLYTWDRWTDPKMWFEPYEKNWEVRWILYTGIAPQLERFMEGIKKKDISEAEYLAPIEENPNVLFFNFSELESYPHIYNPEKLALAYAAQKAPDSKIIVALSSKSSPDALFEMRLELLALGHCHMYFVYIEDKTAQFNFGTMLIQ